MAKAKIGGGNGGIIAKSDGSAALAAWRHLLAALSVTSARV